MSEWAGPHSILDLVLDFDLRPAFTPGVYVVTSDLSPPTPENVLYVGRSKHLGERFGDLAFGLLRLTAPGGWQFHGADGRIMDWCDRQGIDYLDLGYAWLLAECSRCAEIEVHRSLMPTPLNRAQARNCSKHSTR